MCVVFSLKVKAEVFMNLDVQTLLNNYQKEVLKLELQLETKKQQANSLLDRLFEAKRINESEYKKYKERFVISN